MYFARHREKRTPLQKQQHPEREREEEGKREMTVDRLAKMEEAGSGREAD